MRKLTLNDGLSDKRRVHSYLPAYERLFFGLRNTIHSVMEIGVDGGGGLLMLADYFPNAMVFGYDLQPEPEAVKDNRRIHFSQEDAYSVGCISRMTFRAPYAVILDDGPHTIESQLLACNVLPSLLDEDGLLIIEDVQDVAHVKALSDAVQPEFTSMTIDLRHIRDRYDDLLFVVYRK